MRSSGHSVGLSEKEAELSKRIEQLYLPRELRRRRLTKR